ncbi:hypothetical protein QBC44DRAFT_347984 [Cladorrhinum sp. PSN332]|nr:hypothetical protein QBC44DRAFT_347984 [Cladorrhinum sp. PSN332]
MSDQRTQFTHGDYTIGWICALWNEGAAARALLDKQHTELKTRDGNAYVFGSIGNHNIVIASLPEGKPGTSSAATVATRMQNTFPSIKLGILVGVGGGIPGKVELGDVVVSTPVDHHPGVVQWDLGKVETGNTFRRTGALNNPPTALLTALSKLKGAQVLEGSRIPEYLKSVVENYSGKPIASWVIPPATAQVPSSKSSASDFLGWVVQVLREASPGQASKRAVGIHYGLIASGNQVIKDESVRNMIENRLCADGGNLLCIEMEAAGLMNDFPCIVIRGISDYADSRKNDDWQNYAAMVSAAYAKELLSALPAQDVEEMPAIKRIEDVTNKIHETLLDQQLGKLHRAILSWLVPDGSLDYASQQNQNVKLRQPRTGQWFLDSDEFRSWLATENQTLFCPGVPGAGKSVMASIVIDHLQSRFQSVSSFGIAYLFCKVGWQDTQTPENLLASLLKQLVRNQLAQRKSMPTAVKDLYDAHVKNETRPTLREISVALQRVLSLYSRSFIIIDGLDECKARDACRNKFLKEIFILRRDTKLNLLVTSRPQEIEAMFQGCIVREIYAIDEDIKSYIDEQISQWETEHDQDMTVELLESIKTGVVEAADHMFLLAHLNVNMLKSHTDKRSIKEALKNLAKGEKELDKAYEQTMDRLQKQGEGYRKLAEQVLAWIIHAKRPLTTEELGHAVAVRPLDRQLDKDGLKSDQTILASCVGLVRLVDGKSQTFDLIHATTREYLESKKVILFSNAETDAANTCIAYLSFDTFGSGFCQKDDEFRKRLRVNPLYRYAASYWGHHARAAPVDELLTLGLLRDEPKTAACAQAMTGLAPRWINSETMPQMIRGVHLAAFFGLESILTKLLADGGIADCRDDHGRTPLSYAAGEGHEGVVKLLLDMWEADADAVSWVPEGRTPLSYAAEKGHEKVVKLLLQSHRVDPDTRDEGGQSPLYWAAFKGNPAVVEILLETGRVDVNCEDTIGGSSLPWAAQFGHTEVVNLLLGDDKLNMSCRDAMRRFPLLIAATYGHDAVVKLLLAKDDSDINGKDPEYGKTPLSWAARGGHVSVAKILLATGKANLNPRCRYGETPLSWAAKFGHEAMVRLLLGTEGIEVKTEDKWGCTVLSHAAKEGHANIVKLLRETGKFGVNDET